MVETILEESAEADSVKHIRIANTCSETPLQIVCAQKQPTMGSLLMEGF